MSSQDRVVPASLPAGSDRAAQVHDTTETVGRDSRGTRFAAGYSHAMITTARCSAVLAALALPYSTQLTNIALGLAFFAWLMSGRVFELIRAAARHPLAQGAVLLFALVLLGVAWSDASLVQSADAITKYRKLLLLAVLLTLLDTPYWRKAVVLTLLASLAVLLLISIGIYVSVPGLPAPDPLQGAVLKRNHITHGFLMGLLAVAAVVFALTSTHRWVRAGGIVLAILAVGNALAMTYGRTGYLIFGVLLLWVLVAKYRLKGLVAGLAITTLAVALSYGGIESVQQRVDSAVSEVRGFAEGDVVTPTGIRLHYYRRALAIVRDHPVFGAGTGSWPVEYERRSADDPPKLRRVSGMGNPHSEYLLTAVQFGALGVLLHVAALLALLHAARWLPVRRAWLARGTVVAFAVGSLFNSFFWDATEGHAFVLLLAALYGGRWPPDSVDL